MLRVTRKGITRESLAEYALLPSAYGAPDWVSPGSFDMLDETGFLQSKLAARFDAKFENCLIRNALKNGLSISSSTAGKASRLSAGISAVGRYPIPGLLSAEKVESSYAHAHMKDDKRISRDHSSWRSRPRGNDCSFSKRMAHTKNLHGMIRAQLSKRGGHMSQTGIAPDAAPGYFDSLRGANSAGDEEEAAKPPFVWKHQNPPPSKNPAEGDVSYGNYDINPSAGDAPGDSPASVLARSRPTWEELRLDLRSGAMLIILLSLFLGAVALF